MGTEITASGSDPIGTGDLISTGVSIPFSSQRLSAMLFVEPLAKSHSNKPAP